MASPLVLVVEDDADALELRALQLEAAGCRAIAVDNSDDAVREIWHAPLLGGVLTDINLVHAGDDKSGIALARYVREHRPTLPIAGYSGVFAEDRLSDDELGLFDSYYGAGRLTAVEIRSAMGSVVDLATHFEGERRARANERLEAIRLQFGVDPDEFDTFRRLVPNEDLAIEQALAGANLHAQIVGPGTILPALVDDPSASPSALRLRTPIVVWVREVDDGAEAEVHGVPELYSFGESPDAAVANVMQLAVDHFRELSGPDSPDGLDRLKGFLDGVFVQA